MWCWHSKTEGPPGNTVSASVRKQMSDEDAQRPQERRESFLCVLWVWEGGWYQRYETRRGRAERAEGETSGPVGRGCGCRDQHQGC